MPLEYSSYWEHVNIVTVLVAAISGLQSGAIYAFAEHLGTRYFHSLVMSSMFFMGIIAVSWLVAIEWEEWVGIWLLWALFSLGNTIGYRLRSRYEIYRRLKKR